MPFNPATPGVTGGKGLYNIGLLVRCSGQVTYSDTSDPQNKYLIFNDGSGRLCSGHAGVKVLCATVNPPTTGWVIVTGVSTSDSTQCPSAPMILIRDALDIVAM